MGMFLNSIAPYEGYKEIAGISYDRKTKKHCSRVEVL
jgi:hypothetical protein